MNELIEQVLGKTVEAAYSRSAHDQVARALLYLLTRVARSWRSMRVLSKNCPETFRVDGGTIIRAMFDAYLQAAFIAHDPDERQERAMLYLEFEPVEKREILHRILQHDTFVSAKLNRSPRRPEGERWLNAECERVISRYSEGKTGRPRKQWYRGTLRDLATEVGADSEYDLFVNAFHPYVHSSAYGVKLGPPVEPAHMLTFASVMAGRVAKITQQYVGLQLPEVHQAVLDTLASGRLDTL